MDPALGIVLSRSRRDEGKPGVLPGRHHVEGKDGILAGGDDRFGAAGERLTWLSGLVLLMSSLMGWYVGSGDGLTISVIGWHTGTLGKLVFFIGLAVLALVALRQAGIEPPATVPESLIVIALGALATVFVLISLIAALAVIAAGLLRAGDEL